MFNIDTIVEQHYAQAYSNRFDDIEDEDNMYKECECGKRMLTDEKMCDVCKNDIKKRFSQILEENFTIEEIEILNELFDGEEIK